MLIRKVAAALAFTALLSSGPGVARADDVVPVSYVEQLMQRLDAAESKIEALETELGASQASTEGDIQLIGASAVFQDEALKELEEKIEEQAEELADYKKQVFVLPGASGSRKPKLSGRVHADWWSFPNSGPGLNFIETGDPAQTPQDRVLFRRLRFGVAGDVNDLMNYKIEMEFAGGATTTFKDAYLGFKELYLLQTLLIGNQKRPYGLDHLNSSRYNVFMERPFIIEGNNQDARRLGICSYGVSR